MITSVVVSVDLRQRIGNSLAEQAMVVADDRSASVETATDLLDGIGPRTKNAATGLARRQFATPEPRFRETLT